MNDDGHFWDPTTRVCPLWILDCGSFAMHASCVNTENSAWAIPFLLLLCRTWTHCVQRIRVCSSNLVFPSHPRGKSFKFWDTEVYEMRESYFDYSLNQMDVQVWYMKSVLVCYYLSKSNIKFVGFDKKRWDIPFVLNLRLIRIHYHYRSCPLVASFYFIYI